MPEYEPSSKPPDSKPTTKPTTKQTTKPTTSTHRTSSSCTHKKTVTDVTFYVSHSESGSHTFTKTYSTASSLATGCDVAATTKTVSSVCSHERTVTDITYFISQSTSSSHTITKTYSTASAVVTGCDITAITKTTGATSRCPQYWTYGIGAAVAENAADNVVERAFRESRSHFLTPGRKKQLTV